LRYQERFKGRGKDIVIGFVGVQAERFIDYCIWVDVWFGSVVLDRIRRVQTNASGVIVITICADFGTTGDDKEILIHNLVVLWIKSTDMPQIQTANDMWSVRPKMSFLRWAINEFVPVSGDYPGDKIKKVGRRLEAWSVSIAVRY
jgi:hypothetical protein